MPIIKASHAPQFESPSLQVTGLASPSRGSSETSVWRLALAPGAPGALHTVDREEVFVALVGRAVATVGSETFTVECGDALVVPPGTPFSLANPHGEPFEAIAALPVGGKAALPGGEPFVPPWAR